MKNLSSNLAKYYSVLKSEKTSRNKKAETFEALSDLHLINGDEASALKYIENAISVSKKPLLKIKKTRLLASLNDYNYLEDHLTRNINEIGFSLLLEIFLLQDFHSSFSLFLNYQSKYQFDLKGFPGWKEFYEFKVPIINDILKNKFKNQKISLSFSHHIPVFLNLLSDQDIHNLLLNAIEQNIFTFRAGPFGNVEKFLNDNRDENRGVFLPHWFRKLQKNSIIIIDSSGERSIGRTWDLIDYIKKFGFLEKNNLKVLYLSGTEKKSFLGKHIGLSYLNYFPMNLIKSFQKESTFYIKKHKTFVSQKKEKFKFSILIGVPRPFRCAFMMLAYREDLIKRINYTWWGLAHPKMPMKSYSNQFLIANNNNCVIKFTNSEIKWLIELSEIKVENNNYDTANINDREISLNLSKDKVSPNIGYPLFATNVNSLPIKFLYSANYHIVIETQIIGDLRFSEKLFKPILSGVPFICFGNFKIINLLRNIGFDLVDDFIDHSYDEIFDPEQRLIRLINEMKRLLFIKIPKKRIIMMYEKNLIVIENWHKKHYREFSNIYNKILNIF